MIALAIVGLFAIFVWLYSDSDGYAPSAGTFLGRLFGLGAIAFVLFVIVPAFAKKK